MFSLPVYSETELRKKALTIVLSLLTVTCVGVFAVEGASVSPGKGVFCIMFT